VSPSAEDCSWGYREFQHNGEMAQGGRGRNLRVRLSVETPLVMKSSRWMQPGRISVLAGWYLTSLKFLMSGSIFLPIVGFLEVKKAG